MSSEPSFTLRCRHAAAHSPASYHFQQPLWRLPSIGTAHRAALTACTVTKARSEHYQILERSLQHERGMRLHTCTGGTMLLSHIQPNNRTASASAWSQPDRSGEGPQPATDIPLQAILTARIFAAHFGKRHHHHSSGHRCAGSDTPPPPPPPPAGSIGALLLTGSPRYPRTVCCHMSLIRQRGYTWAPR